MAGVQAEGVEAAAPLQAASPPAPPPASTPSPARGQQGPVIALTPAWADPACSQVITYQDLCARVALVLKLFSALKRCMMWVSSCDVAEPCYTLLHTLGVTRPCINIMHAVL